MKIPEVTYDPRAIVGYVYSSDKSVAKSVRHSYFINLDLDREGGLVGIELLWKGSMSNRRQIKPMNRQITITKRKLMTAAGVR